jgi:anthranilate synthase component 1
MANINELEEIVKNARVGTIVPVYKIVDIDLCPVDYFAKLSDYGRKNNSLLLESAEVVSKYGENSVGTADPCLRMVGRGDNFEINGLNDLGYKFLHFIRDRFDFCDEFNYKDGSIKGVLRPTRREASESERLNQKTHMDLIRKVAFAFSPTLKPINHYGGLFGIFSYDFIDQFEDLPKNKEDLMNDPDYEIFFADNLFMYDHKTKQIYFVANTLIMDDDGKGSYGRSLEKIAEYEAHLNKRLIAVEPTKKQGMLKLDSDMIKDEYCDKVRILKRHIVNGDIFQCVLSRTISTDFQSEPLEVYRRLRQSNPSPYMFFIKSEDGILLGSSPERCIGVKGDNGIKTVEIRPIAGTKPRGIINERLDKDLDNRFETELKLDPKELAEHTMLVDLARNDVAKVSVSGTRHVSEPFIVEKYSHVQHLVSSVSGILKPELDPLHAYLASMNMGTLTGAPKIEAMKLLREHEKNKRGFYGGSVFYITPSKDFDSAIVIRSMRLKGNRAYIRAGAGIVYDSIPEKEFDETERKASACINALVENKKNG